MTGIGGIRSAVAAALGVADDAPRSPDASDATATADASLLALVDRLTALLDRSDLAELEVRAGGTGLILRKAVVLHGAAGTPAAVPDAGSEGDPGAATSSATLSARAAGTDPNRPAAAAAEAEGPGQPVLAPLTGIFYSSPSPSAPAFVQVGQEVVVGQVIGLIEAMKLFNEIKSDRAGRVTRVVAASGALVKARQPLIVVEPL
jgi:acetyl-CoA carboxylase biotin carboxyl carrier protein